jgi:hypothetical protein
MPDLTVLPDMAVVVAEVNGLRAERGLGPIERLPKGARKRATACPIARALSNGSRVDVGSGAWAVEGAWAVDGQWYRLPEPLAWFVLAFDDGAYPDLVA